MITTLPGGVIGKMSALFDRLGPCGNIGLLIGMIAGGMLSLLSLMRHGLVDPNVVEVVSIIIMLTLFCWLALLFVYFFFLRQLVRPIMVISLLRALIVCTFTVLITDLIGNYAVGLLVGIFVGLFFGLIFCRMLNRMLG